MVIYWRIYFLNPAGSEVPTPSSGVVLPRVIKKIHEAGLGSPCQRIILRSPGFLLGSEGTTTTLPTWHIVALELNISYQGTELPARENYPTHPWKGPNISVKSPGNSDSLY